ncbi:hypothetical protein R3P38DRAFT_2567184 [Favolaschia claudopus]|uniref:Uncharacterized protein n=1 Tax=Favolaschia claudopus TaxID=2862362 RepID=A0AAV9ZY46_9AGAR
MTTTSLSGLPLPLPSTFDFAAYMTTPPEVPAPVGMNLAPKNARNLVIERTNETSLALTRAYQDAAASTAGVGTLDVGAPLLSHFTYTDEEKSLLVASKDVVESTGPLPVYMTIFIATERMKAARADMDEKAKREAERCPSYSIFGTQLMVNPRIVSAVATGETPIPDIFHVSLHHKIYFPLHWWSDKILRQAFDYPHSIPNTTITAVQTSSLIAPSSVMVVNVAKALKELGEEDEAQLTPGLWRQSARNLLNSFKLLCPPLDPANPSGPKYTHASEFEKPVLFFANLDCFEESMSIWSPVERKLRYELFRDGIFDHRLWEQRIGVVAIRLSFNRDSMTPSSLPPATPASSPSKRALHDDQNPSATKQPRRTRGDEPRGAPPIIREGSAARDRTPCCLICAGPHMAQDHSSTKATFQDGTDHFSRLLVETRDIRTIKPFRGQGSKSLCIGFNINKSCTVAHDADRVHACSLCGGNHPALARHPMCQRVRDGVIIP